MKPLLAVRGAIFHICYYAFRFQVKTASLELFVILIKSACVNLVLVAGGADEMEMVAF